MLGAVDEGAREGVVRFLAAMQTPEGGLRAHARLPLADLLSTFSGSAALADLGAGGAIDRAAAAGFARGLEQPEGGFRAAAWDGQADVEYTFYGLAVAACGRAACGLARDDFRRPYTRRGQSSLCGRRPSAARVASTAAAERLPAAASALPVQCEDGRPPIPKPSKSLRDASAAAVEYPAPGAGGRGGGGRDRLGGGKHAAGKLRGEDRPDGGVQGAARNRLRLRGVGHHETIGDRLQLRPGQGLRRLINSPRVV